MPQHLLGGPGAAGWTRGEPGPGHRATDVVGLATGRGHSAAHPESARDLTSEQPVGRGLAQASTSVLRPRARRAALAGDRRATPVPAVMAADESSGRMLAHADGEDRYFAGLPNSPIRSTT